jgi:hypothetical protein
MALAVPTDALPGPTPAELARISTGAAEIFGAAGAMDWKNASSAVKEMAADWGSFHSGETPELLAGQMSDALDSLERAIRSRKAVDSRLAAIGVAVASLDLQLRHRPPAEIDLARLDLQAATLGIDAAAEDLPAVRSDVANLDWIRDRIAHTLADADRSQIDTLIVEAIGAAGDENFALAGRDAAQVRDLLAELTPE